MTSWTTPRTWVTGEVLSSANMNTHVRDNLAFYGGSDALSSTPPASPGNGQRWVLPVDATNGVYWEFIYYTTGAFWTYTGGAPLRAANETSNTVTEVTSYTALSPAVQVTVPRAGIYNIFVAAAWLPSAGHGVTIAPKIGAAAAADADSLNPGLAVGGEVGCSRWIQKTCAASDVIALQHKDTTTGANPTIYYSELLVLPVHIT
jgi:hypothetical protein